MNINKELIRIANFIYQRWERTSYDPKKKEFFHHRPIMSREAIEKQKELRNKLSKVRGISNAVLANAAKVETLITFDFGNNKTSGILSVKDDGSGFLSIGNGEVYYLKLTASSSADEIIHKVSSYLTSKNNQEANYG